MKLTIIRLQLFSDQDRIDLGKIWPSQDPRRAPSGRSSPIYAARFNERLLGAVRVTLHGVEGELSALCVREVTRRRGVGQYLVEEVLRDNPEISRWQVSDAGVEDRGVMAAFMQALGLAPDRMAGKGRLAKRLTRYLTVAPVSAAPMGKSGLRRFNPAFRVAKGVKTRNPRELTSVSDRG
jgi:GNAT superfamily N-acetyltransferase